MTLARRVGYRIFARLFPQLALKRAFRPIDRKIAAARAAHRPTRALVAERQALLHQLLRGRR